MKTLLSVAGFDPSAGAGALLDIGVFNRLGYHGAAVLTSLTAQDSRSVRDVLLIPRRFILEQFHALAADLQLAGVKFGMLGGAEALRALKEILVRMDGLPRVVDPVFRSSSGYWLLSKDLIPKFVETIRNRTTLITPNIPEAELISGMRIGNAASMAVAARRIRELVGTPCLLKGGHLRGPALDVLYDGRRLSLFRHRRLRRDAHGTGCCLSAAILAYLAGGSSLERACRSAVERTVSSLASARTVGRGRPVLKDF